MTTVEVAEVPEKQELVSYVPRRSSNAALEVQPGYNHLPLPFLTFDLRESAPACYVPFQQRFHTRMSSYSSRYNNVSCGVYFSLTI